MRTSRSRTPRRRGLEEGYRSGLEELVSAQLKEAGIDPRFEVEVIRYEQPVKQRRYTPDFPIQPKHRKKRMYIETKGRFTVADRQKHLMIKKCHPDLDVRFVFSRSKDRISKTSKTTYAMWCKKNGFQYADKLIPEEWLDE